MRFHSSLSFLLSLIFLFSVLSAVSCGSRTTLFDRRAAPAEWRQGPLAAMNSPLQFQIALKHPEGVDEALEQLGLKVSDPTQEEYQDYLSIHEIQERVRPTPKTRSTVYEWLKANGVATQQIQDHVDSLTVTVPVQVASTLFDTEFYEWRNDRRGTTITASFGKHSVPSEIMDHIDLVEGISTFPVPHFELYKLTTATNSGTKMSKKGTNDRKLLQTNFPTVDNEGIVYFSIFDMYNVQVSQTARGAPQCTQGVIEFQGQNMNQDDCDTFGGYLDEGLNTTVAVMIGPNDAANAQIEADLDIQDIMTTNIEATPWFWLNGGNGWLYSFAINFTVATNVPQVISISYGWWEGDQCDPGLNPSGECSHIGGNSTAYVVRCNNEFLKMGLRGVTVVVASGDSGASSRSNDNCTFPELRTEYPASSPWVLSVGATEIAGPDAPQTPSDDMCNLGFQCIDGGDEIAVNFGDDGFTSGGGFSNITSRPSWQDAAVTAYLSNTKIAWPRAGLAWNKNGRAVPDVAAMGHNFLMFDSVEVDDDPFGIGGTSVASPMTAGLIGLLNTVSLSLSGKVLGFVNPFLYQAFAESPTNFNDITVGDNTCTDMGCLPACKNFGFFTAPGYDAVSGLGSLNHQNLVDYLTKMSAARKVKFPHKYKQ